MKTKEYDALLKERQTIHSETQERIQVAQKIAINLYRKHFHNFLSYTQYRETFPWLNSTTLTKTGLEANGKPVPKVYLSKDTWKIASTIRREAYQAAYQLSLENLKEAQRKEQEARHLLNAQVTRSKRAKEATARAKKTVALRMRYR